MSDLQKNLAMLAGLIALCGCAAVGQQKMDERNEPLNAADTVFNYFVASCAALADTRKYYRSEVSTDDWSQEVNARLDATEGFWQHLPISQYPYPGVSAVRFYEASAETRGKYFLKYEGKESASPVARSVIHEMVDKAQFAEVSKDPRVPSCDKLDRNEPIHIGRWTWAMTPARPKWLYRESDPQFYWLQDA